MKYTDGVRVYTIDDLWELYILGKATHDDEDDYIYEDFDAFIFYNLYLHGGELVPLTEN